MLKLSIKLKQILNSSYNRFVLKKAGFYSLALFIALTFAFFIPRFMSEGDRNIWIVYFFNLDKPLEEQYLIFWENLLKMDLGPSFNYYPMTVVDVMLPRLVFSLVLVIPVLFISFYIGNWIGAKAAYLKGRINDAVYMFFLCLRSAPFYWLGLIIFIYFVTGNNIFLSHPGGISPQMSPGFNIDYFIDLFRHYMAPFLTLIIVNAGFWAVGMRAMILYEMETSYIYYAKHMGFRPKILRQYSQRNAILPQFTLLNLRFNELISETLIVEYVFLWPGIGTLYMESLFNRDYPLIMGITIVILVIAIIGNFLVDITYGFLDPRIKTGQKG
ncbi:MAG: ABC transporter permease [Promethearchaeota archaeon]